MANLKELRTRIGSVKNTRKITAAMSQIAAARLRKAQNAVTAARPYGERMDEVVASLVAGIKESERADAHPLLSARKVERIAVIAMTAERGLCGGFNSNVNRHIKLMLEAKREQGVHIEVWSVGRKGTVFLKHYGEDLEGRTFDAANLDNLVDLSKRLSNRAVAGFMAGPKDEARVDQVLLVYNRFVSVLTQEVTEVQLVPLVPADTEGDALEPTFEPSRDAILEHLVPVAIESQLQQAMFNSVAAEIAARRVAMDAATDNASELIADLTLDYNRERQAAITSELMEIIGGAEALKG